MAELTDVWYFERRYFDFMARIKIEDYNGSLHPNPMQSFDSVQRERHHRAPTLVPYKVCLVTVSDFTFIFHSIEQIQLCMDYYSRKTHSSSRLPVYTENIGGDHWETQRWFERLPQHLLENSHRPRVESAQTGSAKVLSVSRDLHRS